MIEDKSQPRSINLKDSVYYKAKDIAEERQTSISNFINKLIYDFNPEDLSSKIEKELNQTENNKLVELLKEKLNQTEQDNRLLLIENTSLKTQIYMYKQSKNIFYRLKQLFITSKPKD